MNRFTALLAAVVLALATVACSKTDAGITTEVKTKLAADDTVKAYQIDVDTKDKVVTLTGNVDSTAARDRALMIARNNDGVTSVVDRLVVAGGSVAGADAARDAAAGAGAVVTDAALTTAVKTKLLADTTVGGLKIDVDTKDGIVTLTGKVKNATEKNAALQIARTTDGVKGVTDNLTIGS